jgi:hypothetical protein
MRRWPVQKAGRGRVGAEGDLYWLASEYHQLIDTCKLSRLRQFEFPVIHSNLLLKLMPPTYS